ncbi:hypothetical protein [Streptomyces sp. URMC 123]|uniref:hypothetical protein n=1 Tax=Streptomyces sp. URMC 123 TaxID=3423403 RepID=UPI003F1DC133
MNTGLPEGWTIERVRAHSGARNATELSLDRLVVIENADRSDYTTLRPDVILQFGGLCLARDEGDWYMGQLDVDGSVICWGSYGDDLGEAIHGL